jgi:hypothetical protein
MVPAWFEEEPEKEGSTLEEPRIKASGDPKETSLAPEG